MNPENELKAFFDENGELVTNETSETFKADYGLLGEEEYFKMLQHGLENFNYYDEPTIVDTDIIWAEEKMYKVCYKGYSEMVSLSMIEKCVERMLKYE